MNRFEVINCIDIKEKDYSGTCVVLSCTSDPSFLLFFPVSKENAKIIKYILNDNKYDINTNILGIYKTMIESWYSSDRHLSGIIMDSVYHEELKDDVIDIRLVIIDQDGNVDSLVPASFLHSIILAAMERTEIVVNEKLINKMVPQDDEEEMPVKKTHHFPEDKKIMSIAKKIMSGKIKNK